MKCDKLEEWYAGQFSPSARVYGAFDVTEAIAELKVENLNLKAKNERLKEDCASLKMNEGNAINATHETEEYAMQLYRELRATRRALWIARAKRALEKIAWFKLWNSSISTMNPEDGARQEFDKWKKALGKCLKKAEEYK